MNSGSGRIVTGVEKVVPFATTARDDEPVLMRQVVEQLCEVVRVAFGQDEVEGVDDQDAARHGVHRCR